MKVTVKLFATFRENRFKIEERVFDDQTTLGNIIDLLGIEREEVGVLMVNSRHANFDTIPNAADIVAIFPIIGGG